jgi:hypothetical protein
MANELESVTPTGRELAGTVLEAFTRHRLVGMGNHTACRTITTRCRCCSPTRGALGLAGQRR